MFASLVFVIQVTVIEVILFGFSGGTRTCYRQQRFLLRKK